MRYRRSTTARLTHVATVAESPPITGVRRRRSWLVIPVTAGLILATFFGGRALLGRYLAEHWRQSLATVSDDRAEMLVASAARLGRPGLPVLVEALASPRESVAAAGRQWLDRQLKSWENLPNRQAQRNIAALAEALAAKVDSLDPAARVEVGRLAARMLRWHFDDEIVDRARVTWLCDEVLQAAKFAQPPREEHAAEEIVATRRQEEDEDPLQVIVDSWAADTTMDTAAQPPATPSLIVPQLSQEAEIQPRIAARAGRLTAPNLVPLPRPSPPAPSHDLADSWSMRPSRLEEDQPLRLSETAGFPGINEGVFYPSTPEPDQAVDELNDQNSGIMSLDECMHRLHGPGLEALAAEAELKRRGLAPLRLSIARRVYHPDKRERLELVRQLPNIPGAVNWLLMMAADEDEEVRLEAITLLSTVGDPNILARVESMARSDPAERIRLQAQRLARHRQSRNR